MRHPQAVLCCASLLAAAGAGLGGRAIAAADNATLTAVPGIRVGQITRSTAAAGLHGDPRRRRGRRGRPSRSAAARRGTRETDVLDPVNMSIKINAVAPLRRQRLRPRRATGVVRWLDEHGIGWPTGTVSVPIVPAA